MFQAHDFELQPKPPWNIKNYLDHATRVLIICNTKVYFDIAVIFSTQYIKVTNKQTIAVKIHVAEMYKGDQILSMFTHYQNFSIYIYI